MRPPEVGMVVKTLVDLGRPDNKVPIKRGSVGTISRIYDEAGDIFLEFADGGVLVLEAHWKFPRFEILN